MAQRIAKSSINWVELGERASKTQRTQFLAFKAKSDNYLKRVQSLPAELPKIDWNFYKSKIPVAGLVESFQKNYEGLNIQYPKDNVTQQVEAQEKVVRAKLTDFHKKCDESIASLQAKIAEEEKKPLMSQITMEEAILTFPESFNVQYYEGTFDSKIAIDAYPPSSYTYSSSPH